MLFYLVLFFVIKTILRNLILMYYENVKIMNIYATKNIFLKIRLIVEDNNMVNKTLQLKLFEIIN